MTGGGKLEKGDLELLEAAKLRLDNPGLPAKIGAAIGTPIERGFELLPENWREAVDQVADQALGKALAVALRSMDRGKSGRSNDAMHQLLAAASGGVGGAFGLQALALELPLSTTIMLRSIADIARSEGEHLDDPRAQLACLEVFALGGKSDRDDPSDFGYYAVRSALAKSISEAAEHLAKQGLTSQGSPAVVRLISSIASRFGIVVSKKAAAQAIPIIGAAGGALINTLFLSHYQEMARGHFTVRRLERNYGELLVRAAYEKLPDQRG